MAMPEWLTTRASELARSQKAVIWWRLFRAGPGKFRAWGGEAALMAQFYSMRSRSYGIVGLAKRLASPLALSPRNGD